MADMSKGWVSTTELLDAKPATSGGLTDAFLPVGETFVFEADQSHSIVIKTVSIDTSSSPMLLTVSVQYVDGVDVMKTYETTAANAAHLCSHTLSCGKTVNVDLAGGTAVPGSGKTLVRIGEADYTKSAITSCASNVASLNSYFYLAFPAAQLLHGASADVQAAATLSDYCGSGSGPPATLQVPTDATGCSSNCWWINDQEYVLSDYKYRTIEVAGN